MAMPSPVKLVVWVLSALNLCPLATSFAHRHHHHGITYRAIFVPSSAVLPRRDRGTALRLAPPKEQQGEDDNTASSASISEFEQTSGPVKAVVGGLTDLFILFSGDHNKKEPLPPTPKV